MNTKTSRLTPGITFLSAALSLLLISPLWAQQPVDETRAAEPDARIEFHAVTGRFQFAPSDSGRLEISGTLGADVRELEIEGDASHWRVVLHHPRNFRGSRRSSESDLVIAIPRGADLEARAVSGSIELVGLEGNEVRASTVSGDVDAAGLSPYRLEIETVSGRIRADGGGREDSRFKTVSGSIDVTGLAGRAQVHSVSGNLKARGRSLEDFHAETVSGRIEAELSAVERSRLQLLSHSGDISLAIPAETGLNLRAGTFSGSIRSALGGEVTRGRGPGETLALRTGAGNVSVGMNSFSGRIRIEELDR